MIVYAIKYRNTRRCGKIMSKPGVLQPGRHILKKDRRGVMTYNAQEMFIAEC